MEGRQQGSFDSIGTRARRRCDYQRCCRAERLKPYLTPLVAGATGYTGRRLLPLLDHTHPVSWVRMGSRSKPPAQGTIVRAHPDDPQPLVPACRRVQAIVQLVGTTRSQFAAGNSYEVADIGTTQTLIAAAQEAGNIERFVLLSSVGAGRPVGSYLKAKQQAEQIVCDSGIPAVIVRPSSITGSGRSAAKALKMFTPRTTGIGARFHPIGVTQLARLIASALDPQLHIRPSPLIWEGRTLWARLREIRIAD